MKTSKFRMTTIAGFAVVVLMLAGCAGGGPTSSDSTSGETPTEGGELTIVVGESILNWDPGASTGSFPAAPWDKLYAVYGALITVSNSGEIEPGLAESVTTDDGGKTWTLTLREGLAFTDGTALDASVVKENWDRFADPANHLGAARVADTFTTTVIDDTTLEIASEAPNPVLDIQIADAIPFIGAPSTFTDPGETMTKPIGAGPFILEKSDQSVGETLTKNADYYMDGLPYLDTLNFVKVVDPAQRMSTVVQGGAEIMNGYPFYWVNEGENPAITTTQVPSGGIRQLVFNTNGELFSDLRARQAVELAVDPTELVQTLTQDPSAVGSTSLFPESSPYYDESMSLPETDLEAAQALVDEVTADGTPFTLDLLIATVPELVRAGELLQLTLQQLDGVKVNLIQTPDWRTTAFDNDAFDLTFYPGVFDLNSPEIGVGNLFSVGGIDNFAGFDDEDMTKAVTAAGAAATDEDRATAIRDVQQVYVDRLPIMVFGIDYRSFFHDADVVGIQSMGRGALYSDRIGYRAE